MNKDAEMMYTDRKRKKKTSAKNIQALKRGRKKRRIKRMRIIIFMSCTVILLYLISGMLHKSKMFSVTQSNRVIGAVSVENLTKPKRYTSDESRAKLASLANSSTEYRTIYDNIDAYPKELLEALCSNPEILEFTLGYLNKDNMKTGGLTQEELKTQYPLLMQWDKRWGYVSYGDSCIGLAGCAPTCMSMVIVALTNKQDTIWIV
jgi:hypothetical protein